MVRSLYAKWRLGEGARCTSLRQLGGSERLGVLTTRALQDEDAEAAISLENLTLGLNEFLLFHGTSNEAAMAICQKGFEARTDGAIFF